MLCADGRPQSISDSALISHILHEDMGERGHAQRNTKRSPRSTEHCGLAGPSTTRDRDTTSRDKDFRSPIPTDPVAVSYSLSACDRSSLRRDSVADWRPDRSALRRNSGDTRSLSSARDDVAAVAITGEARAMRTLSGAIAKLPSALESAYSEH